MTPDELVAQLERRAPEDWELYTKRAESRELVASPRFVSGASRSEEGFAARWWEKSSPRFACGSDPEELVAAIARATGLSVAERPRLSWPSGRSSGAPEREASDLSDDLPQPGDLFESLSRLLSAESRGEALLSELTIRVGSTFERIRNGRGLAISVVRERAVHGSARAVGRRGTRSCEARALFQWDAAPELESLARRLADRAVLPLSERPTPVTRGEWLLDPSVSAALLAGVAPLFCSERPPRWVHRGQLFSPRVTLVDDAAVDAAFDGEGTPTRRVVLVDRGAWLEQLRDLTSAARSGGDSTGHGTRPSYRTPPVVGPRRLFFESSETSQPRELLSSVRRGLFASALTSPIRIDLEQDRFEAEFTGVAIVAGRALGPVAGARAAGRISELLRRITAIGTDRQFFPVPYPAGAPTVLIERASFE